MSAKNLTEFENGAYNVKLKSCQVQNPEARLLII